MFNSSFGFSSVKNLFSVEYTVVINTKHIFSNTLYQQLHAHIGLMNNARLSYRSLKLVFLALLFVRIGYNQNNELWRNICSLMSGKLVPKGYHGLVKYLPASGARLSFKGLFIKFVLSDADLIYIENAYQDKSDKGLALAISEVSRYLDNDRFANSESFDASITSSNSSQFSLNTFGIHGDDDSFSFYSQSHDLKLTIPLAISIVFLFSPSTIGHLQQHLQLFGTTHEFSASFENVREAASSAFMFLLKSNSGKPVSKLSNQSDHVTDSDQPDTPSRVRFSPVKQAEGLHVSSLDAINILKGLMQLSSLNPLQPRQIKDISNILKST